MQLFAWFHHICLIRNCAYVKSLSFLEQLIKMLDRHSIIPAQLIDKASERVSGGGLECHLLNL